MIHYMIGLPGESAEEINATLAFALDLYDRFPPGPPSSTRPRCPAPASPPKGPSLPVLSDSDDGDWGPRFQRAASGVGGVPPDLLARFMWTFEQRLRASGARRS
jgi:hypothetical protein